MATTSHGQPPKQLATHRACTFLLKCCHTQILCCACNQVRHVIAVILHTLPAVSDAPVDRAAEHASAAGETGSTRTRAHDCAVHNSIRTCAHVSAPFYEALPRVLMCGVKHLAQALATSVLASTHAHVRAHKTFALKISTTHLMQRSAGLAAPQSTALAANARRRCPCRRHHTNAATPATGASSAMLIARYCLRCSRLLAPLPSPQRRRCRHRRFCRRRHRSCRLAVIAQAVTSLWLWLQVRDDLFAAVASVVGPGTCGCSAWQR
jgi:hypothetical protein